MRIGIRYAGNQQDAEQWVHDGFLKIFQSLEQYTNAGSFEGWIKKIMVRTCLDNIRKERAKKNEVDYNTVYNEYKHAEAAHYIDNEIVAKMDMQQLIQLLNTLPDKQRTVFNLHVFEGYGHKEIAELIAITENHSYWLLHQARKNLKVNITTIINRKEASYE